eukprot:1849427-Amphidinium_carterae.1
MVQILDLCASQKLTKHDMLRSKVQFGRFLDIGMVWILREALLFHVRSSGGLRVKAKRMKHTVKL